MIQHITIYKVKYQKHQSVPINDPNVWSAHFFPTHNFFIQRPCTLLCKNGLHTFDWHVILHTSQSDITRIVKDAWCNNFVTCRQKDTDAGFHRNVMHLSKRCTQTHAHTNREGGERGGRERLRVLSYKRTDIWAYTYKSVPVNLHPTTERERERDPDSELSQGLIF